MHKQRDGDEQHPPQTNGGEQPGRHDDNAEKRRHRKRRRKKARAKNSPGRPRATKPRPAGNGKGTDHHLPVQQEQIDRTAAETAEKLALGILAAMVSEKVLSGMSAIFDELIEGKSALLDDDDEEQDEGWVDDRRRREGELLDEAITDTLAKYPDINAINDLPTEALPTNLSKTDPPTNTDRDYVEDAKQLRETLAKYPKQPIGAITFEEKFSRDQFKRMVRRDIKERFRRDTKYREHVCDEVPGSDPKPWGKRGRTSSRGTFVKADSFVQGGGLIALFTGGWMRVAKDRIDPYAWSHEHGRERKTERKNWRQVFRITERDGRQSFLEIPREKLAGNGGTAIKLLMKAGIHIVHRNLATTKAFMRFLRFKPRLEIIRMPQTGWYEIDGHWIYVRSNETLLPPALRESKRPVAYVIDHAHDPDQYGHQIKGTTKQWQDMIAIPLRGNSNIALAFATSFASP